MHQVRWQMVDLSQCLPVCIAFGQVWPQSRSCNNGRGGCHRPSQDVSQGVASRTSAILPPGRDRISLRRGEPRAGVSLDIIKAFNNVPRAPAAELLVHLGVPKDFVRLWQDFLSKAQRCAEFQGGLGSPFGATTGVPEGDPLSVVAMVALCWMASQVAVPESCDLRTYVDNFSWLASDVSGLKQCLISSQQFCQTLSLPIDWKKSYSWATSHDLRNWLDRHAADFLPPATKLQRVMQAKDLGVVFRYGRGASLAKGEPRLQEGLRRIDALSRQPRPVSNKAFLLQGAIWPQCFYAQEGRALSQRQVATFRSKAAKALAPCGHSQSPFLALACVSRSVQDPEVFLLIQALSALHRAFRVQPQTAQKVLEGACLALTSGEKVVGPATAMACLLHRNGWSLSEEGVCKGPGCTEISLRYCGRKSITRAVLTSWATDLHHQVNHRNGLSQLGAIDFRATQHAVAQTPAEFHVVAANCISGGHMSAAAQSQWDPLVDPKCRFCGDRDTKWHRCFDCPLASTVRKAFDPMLQWVKIHSPHWIHASVVQEHPDTHVFRLLCNCRRFVPPPDPRCEPYNGKWVFYTDGSCNTPRCVEARHAAWSVVVDAAQQIPTMQLLSHFATTNTVPPAFHVVAQGLCPGVQNIGRAEVCAVLQVATIAARFPQVICEVWVDSTYAIHFMHQLEGASPAQFTSPDVDLCKWADLWSFPPNLVVRKVKAHSSLDTVPIDMVRPTLGNRVADTAAKSARLLESTTILQLVDDIESHFVIHHDMLVHYLRYQFELTKLVAAAQSSSGHEVALPHDPQSWKQQWLSLQPHNCTAAALPAFQEEWCLFAPWPPWFTTSVWAWTTQLLWPSASEGTHRHSGITNVELLASYVATTSKVPPIREGGSRARAACPSPRR